MAGYLDLRGLFSNSDIINKIDIAVIVAANNVIVGTPTVGQKKWAAFVFDSPRVESKKALMAIIAKNKELTINQILSATDNAIQSQVDSIVDLLVSAFEV